MLQKTKRFQDDVANYTKIIDTLVDEQEQLAAKRLLNDLIHEVKNMDSMYESMVYAKQLPSLGDEFKQKIQQTRKKLQAKLNLRE